MKLATTTCDFDFFCDSYLERVKRIATAGFKYIDLSLYEIAEEDELLISENWREAAEELKRYAAENGIEFVQCHSPNTNPLAEGELERAIALNKRALEICGVLGIPNMVVHMGWDPKASKEEWFERNRVFVEALFDSMEENGVNLLHENTTSANMPWFYPKTGAQMREFSEYINHPRFHSCWDTGHANIEGSQYDEIIALGDDLYALHINDNRGSQDEHIIPYFGTLNMDEIMCALNDIGFKGAFTFESGSTLRHSDCWFGARHGFEREKRISEPTVEMQQRLEELMYFVGKHILTAYNEFEN